MNGNVISASIPTPSDSNADNAPSGRNNKNNMIRLPRFISNSNEIVLRVFEQKQSMTKQNIVPRHEIKHESLGTVSSKDLNQTFENNVDSHPNGSILHVFKEDLD